MLKISKLPKFSKWRLGIKKIWKLWKPPSNYFKGKDLLLKSVQEDMESMNKSKVMHKIKKVNKELPLKEC